MTWSVNSIAHRPATRTSSKSMSFSTISCLAIRATEGTQRARAGSVQAGLRWTPAGSCAGRRLPTVSRERKVSSSSGWLPANPTMLAGSSRDSFTPRTPSCVHKVRHSPTRALPCESHQSSRRYSSFTLRPSVTLGCAALAVWHSRRITERHLDGRHDQHQPAPTVPRGPAHQLHQHHGGLLTNSRLVGVVPGTMRCM